jgi:hypothetical protein
MSAEAPLRGYDGKLYGVGDRIELHPDTALWKQGARYGTVIGTVPTPKDRVRVRLDALPTETYAGNESTFRRARFTKAPLRKAFGLHLYVVTRTARDRFGRTATSILGTYEGHSPDEALWQVVEEGWAPLYQLTAELVTDDVP